MLDPQESCFDHLTASAQLCRTVSSPMLFTVGQSAQKKQPTNTYVHLFRPLKKNKKVMVDHLQSHGTPLHNCTNHKKVGGTLSKKVVSF